MKIIDRNTGLDLTDKTNAVIVGQQINLACQLATTNFSIQSYQWSVPGNAISNFLISSDFWQTNGSAISLTDITNSSVNFYWIDGGSKSVSCRVKVAGQTTTAQATFIVKKPSALLIATAANPVEIDSAPNPNLLVFGDPPFPGISFTAANEDTLGDWKYFQVGHQLFRYQDATTGTWVRGEGTGLDGPYPNDHGSDAPSTQLPSGSSKVEADGSFTKYLAFRLATGGIYVPIRQVQWSWSGSGIFTNGAWVLSAGTNNVPSADSPVSSIISWTNSISATLTNIVSE